MAFGNLKVQDLIYEDGSNNEITVVLSNLATKASPAFTRTVTGVNLTLSGDLQVNGTTTTINTTTLQVEDKNIEIGKVSSPSDTTADGGGWSLLGSTTKTFNWVNATDAWTSSEHLHLLDNKKLLLGTSSECTFFHDNAGHTYLTTSTGNFHIQCPGGENSIRAIPNGGVELYHNNVKKFETTSAGVTVQSQLKVEGSETSQLNGNQLRFQRTSTSYIDQIGGGSLAFRTMHSGSETTRMTVQSGGNVNLPDNGHLTFGASNDLQIRHSGSHGYITTITGNLLLQAASHIQLKPANGEDAIQAVANGAVELFYDNVKKFETFSGGVKINGGLQLIDDGTNNIWRGGTQTNWIQSDGNTYITKNFGTEYSAKFNTDGAVELFYDNAIKLQTTSSGIQVSSDGSASDGAKLTLKHLNNNSTDVISSILFNNNAGEAARIQAETVGANNTGVIKFYTDNAGTSAVACTIGSDGTVSDSKGDLRKIPRELKGSAYTLVAADAGKCIATSAGVTVPHNVLGTGDAVTIINNSGSDITITQASSLTMHNSADASSGNRTLAGKGMATVWFSSGAEAYISGAGLS